MKIENEAQYDAVMARIDELLPLVTESTPAEDRNSVELLLLSSLAADYEDEHYPVGVPSLTDILRLRMYEMGLTQRSMASFLGISPARLSEIVSGKREPTYRLARTISTRLDISPSIVLGI